MFDRQRKDAELRRLQRVKQTAPRVFEPIGGELVTFFKRSVEKRHTKLGKLAECWATLVPELLQEHCALNGLSKGTLTVVVDSSPHLYDLKQLLLSGLERQLVEACKSTGLRRICLKPGRWYSGDSPREGKLSFD